MLREPLHHTARVRRIDGRRRPSAVALGSCTLFWCDDIEDDSDQRRGRPTLHTMVGVPVAVNVGDALTLLGLRALIDNHTTLGPRLTCRPRGNERMAREASKIRRSSSVSAATMRSLSPKRTTSRWC
jgi:geranylgeranyl pyrophosphate synthase